MRLIVAGILPFLFSSLAYAYVGPGLGYIGVILGLLFSVFLALFGLFWYPLKRFMGKVRKLLLRK